MPRDPESRPQSTEPISSDFQRPYYIGKHLVPGIWKYFFPDDLENFRFPDERFASCGSCPMVASSGYVTPHKCCTHIPRVPNFLLGMALQDDASQQNIRQAIAGGFALPEGIVITPMQSQATLEQNAAGMFGRDKKVKCNFLDLSTGGCGIYKYRNATCSTFFCKNNFGNEGAAFWEHVQAAAGQIEYALSWWCMREVGLAPDEYLQRFDDLSTALVAGKLNSWEWPEEARRVLWQDWFGREEEYFRACATAVHAQKDRLYEIACQVPLKRPDLFEHTFRSILNKSLRDELDLDSPQGTPEAIESLWYRLTLAHRNLWHLPPPETPFLVNPAATITENPCSSVMDRHYQALAFKVTVDGVDHYLNHDEMIFLKRFEQPTTVSHDLFDEYEAVDAWSLFLELKAKQIVGPQII